MNDYEYKLDNDENIGENCNKGSRGKGVNLLISSLDEKARKELDLYFDKEIDPDCGRIRYKNTISNAGLFFRIDSDQGWE